MQNIFELQNPWRQSGYSFPGELPFANDKALFWLERYLRYGGYPAVIVENDERQRQIALREI
jgi:uncharacterized protein with PIN domain